MANSDKNILITPNVGAATGSQPTIAFTGANNTPITLRTLDTGTVSFEATAGQLFSIADGLTGTIFSVNDISGIPSIEVLSTGLIKLNEYNGQTVIGGASAAGTAELTIYPSLNTSLGLVIKGLASQSGNLQEWQDSTGTVLTSIGPTGNIISQSILATGVFRLNDANSLSATAHIVNTSGANIGLLVKGHSAQSANLQEWQNSSGTVLASISSTGAFAIPSLTVSGDLTVNGTTTIINTNSLTVDDKNIELGSVPSGTVSTTGTVGSISGSGPWTATITGMTTTVGLIPGSAIAATNGTGSLGAGGTYIVTSIVSSTSVTFSATGGTTPTTGTVTNITTTGATNLTADGGGITLKGATDKTFNWINSTGAWTSSEPISSPYLIVTGSTVPTNGMYLPAANTLGFATNSTVQLQMNSLGNIGIGVAPVTGRAFTIQTGISGTANSRGINILPTLSSDVTSDYFGVQVFPGTAASSFTLSQINYFRAAQGSFGAGSTVTNQYGFWVDSSVIGATNNFGFYGNIPSGANRWNFYAGGTAANYFAGQTTVGSTSLTLGGGGVAQQFGVVSGAATTVPLVIRGATSQSANYIEWQDSAGTVIGFVDSIGRGKFVTGLFGTLSSSIGANLSVATNATTTIGLIVRGIASQSANLQEWQNSAGTALAFVSSNGNFSIGQGLGATSANIEIGSNRTADGSSYIDLVTDTTYTDYGARIIRGASGANSNTTINNRGTGTLALIAQDAGTVSFQTSSATRATISATGTFSINGFTSSSVGLIVRGAVSQTANLQEWQNSASSIIARVTSGGAFYANSGIYSTFFASINQPTTASYIQFASNSTRIITQSDETSFIVVGVAAQTADLQRWQTSTGTVLAAINISGGLELNGKDVELMSIMGAY